MFVCLSVTVLDHISRTARPNFAKFYADALYGRGSALIWRRCSTLCTSGFVDDVIIIRPRLISRENATSVLLSAVILHTNVHDFRSHVSAKLKNRLITKYSNGVFRSIEVMAAVDRPKLRQFIANYFLIRQVAPRLLR